MPCHRLTAVYQKHLWAPPLVFCTGFALQIVWCFSGATPVARTNSQTQKQKRPQFKENNQLRTQDINLKNTPANFGIDRALGCFAALKITDNPYKKNIIIADFGTTLSITKINSKGKLLGGQLIPGFLTQLRSMAINTRYLEMPKNMNIPKDNFVIGTQESMIKGVLNGLVGAINLAFNPEEDILIICGGDSEMIGANLPRESQEIMIKPNLVMEGMVMFHKK